MTYAYVRDAALERDLKKAHTDKRRQMAKAWRKARGENPAIARLLWRRIRKAEAEFAESLFT